MAAARPLEPFKEGPLTKHSTECFIAILAKTSSAQKHFLWNLTTYRRHLNASPIRKALQSANEIERIETTCEIEQVELVEHRERGTS